MTHARRILSHTALAVLEGALVASLVVALLAGTALAGRGGGGGKPPKPAPGGGGTIALVLLDTSNSVANYGERIRFNISTTATTEPWVRLYCYQGGALVAQGSEGYFERSLDDGVFGLYSPAWSGGAADCTAKLTTPSGSVLATTTFHVDP